MVITEIKQNYNPRNESFWGFFDLNLYKILNFNYALVQKLITQEQQMSENGKKKKKYKKIGWVLLAIGLIWLIMDGMRGAGTF